MAGAATGTQTSPIGEVNTLLPAMQGTIGGTYAGGPSADLGFEIRRVSDDAAMWVGVVGTGSPYTPWSFAYAGTTLTTEVEYKWRVRVSDGLFGAWSSYVNFTPVTNTAPTATQVAPASGAQGGTLTPTYVASFTDPEPDTYVAGTFAAYQIQVRRVSDSVSFWDTGQVAVTSGEAAARQVAVVHAGTALVSAIAYEWRVRLQDGGGLWSNYTAYSTFTPALAPNAPTVTGPSGLTNTLTPTISGVYSQGLGGTESDFQYEIRQVSTTIYQSGDVAADIATGQAYGTANSGDTPSTPPALAWGTSYSVRLRSKDNVAVYSDWSAWTAFNTNAAPTTATSLVPSGAAITGDTTPDLSWVHNDADADAQTAVEIEMYDLTASAFVTDYNPKALTQATLTHTTVTTLTATHDYRWRIRTKGLAAPGFGPWSDYALFTVQNVPTVTLTAPTPAQVLVASAVTVTWTFSGGTGTEQDWRVIVYASDQATIVYDSGVIAGTDVTATVPAGYLRNSLTYYVQVTARDTNSLAGVTSKVAVSTNWTPPATVTGLSAIALGDQS